MAGIKVLVLPLHSKRREVLRKAKGIKGETSSFGTWAKTRGPVGGRVWNGECLQNAREVQSGEEVQGEKRLSRKHGNPFKKSLN